MKKIVFATLLACSTAANAQISMDLPSLWWPEEFTTSWGEKVISKACKINVADLQDTIVIEGKDLKSGKWIYVAVEKNKEMATVAAASADSNKAPAKARCLKK